MSYYRILGISDEFIPPTPKQLGMLSNTTREYSLNYFDRLAHHFGVFISNPIYQDYHASMLFSPELTSRIFLPYTEMNVDGESKLKRAVLTAVRKKVAPFRKHKHTFSATEIDPAPLIIGENNIHLFFISDHSLNESHTIKAILHFVATGGRSGYITPQDYLGVLRPDENLILHSFHAAATFLKIPRRKIETYKNCDPNEFTLAFYKSIGLDIQTHNRLEIDQNHAIGL